jgi:transcriptional regulator of acetoin/glycerol metabolism
MASNRLNHSDRVLQTVQSGHQAGVSAVAASWCRSALHHGLDPAATRHAERLEGAALGQLRQSNGELIAAATPVLDQLYASVGRAGCCVILSDLGGVVLEARSSQADGGLFESIGLAPGGQWGEGAEGTNGIGTCLVEARPVTIARNDHFAARNVGVSCMDAPVFDPDGQLAGALDVSSARADHGEAMATLVQALVMDAARQIERDFFCRRFADARIVYAAQGSGSGVALLAVDRDDLVIGATRGARQQFRLGAKPRFDPRPLADVMGTMASSFDDSERLVLRQALARSGGNVAAAARSLGIGRATFYRRMERLGLTDTH